MRRAHLCKKGLVVGSLSDVSCGRSSVLQVFQETAPDLVSACVLLNQGICREVLNLPHEAGDEHTGDIIGTEVLHSPQSSSTRSTSQRYQGAGFIPSPRMRLVLQTNQKSPSIGKWGNSTEPGSHKPLSSFTKKFQSPL